MNFDFLSKFHPKLLDVVVRNAPFWQKFDYELIRKSTRLHTLGLVGQGSGTLRLNDRKFSLAPGCLFQVTPGQHMHIQTGQEDTLVFNSVHYAGHLADEAGADFETLKHGLPFPVHAQYADWQPLLRQFQAMWSEWNDKRPGYEWRCRLHYFSILEEIVRLETAVETGASDGNGMERVVRYMNDNYGKPLNRDRLAAYAGWSPTYFSTLFKEQTGQSPIQYLNKVRIDRAKQLLRSTSLPITRIAADVGFADSFYFARIFTKATGFSPSEYRKA